MSAEHIYPEPEINVPSKFYLIVNLCYFAFLCFHVGEYPETCAILFFGNLHYIQMSTEVYTHLLFCYYLANYFNYLIFGKYFENKNTFVIVLTMGQCFTDLQIHLSH